MVDGVSSEEFEEHARAQGETRAEEDGASAPPSTDGPVPAADDDDRYERMPCTD